MRIWDISPKKLCRKHLLGEHGELHALWNILTQGKTEYSLHPETIRWKGKLKALFLRHEELVKEMKKRGYHHYSPLNQNLAVGKSNQDVLVDSLSEQIKNLHQKRCECKL